ncbi:AraC family transcriptional regulator [Novosphingobium sp. G106]|uniref:AraC family transcriptional regulator n=1 Tax=Novosphingobium sp. G106 TaxID=2849500 RepID=UPI001C2DA454|nr:AraC family transcriptional regulator [Novosphingobium sp. G106]MBV1686445.1 AraC family transcriptional regulator [Novosphingobium sp. G106]
MEGLKEIIDSAASDGEARADAHHAMVRSDVLLNYDALVRSLGGDAEAIMRTVGISSSLLAEPNAVIPFRAVAQLLERSAAVLDCDDFGLRLASIQGGAKVLGPLEVVMRNSQSLGAAYRYCADHVHAYSDATRISLQQLPHGTMSFLRFDILIPKLPYQRQAVEQAMLLAQEAAKMITSGRTRAREVWFLHEAALPASMYQKYFGTTVRFCQGKNGLVFENGDLALPLQERDPQLLEMAKFFIDARFPTYLPQFSVRVRNMIEQTLASGDCCNANVATQLGMHPRTMQRRLREEGSCFESIKEEVRRDSALRYLTQTRMPLMRVAEMLGYSETSVLSRSCFRWFGASPRRVREQKGASPALSDPAQVAA